MLSIPVIGRELLTAARSPQYRMRTGIGAIAMLFVAGVFSDRTVAQRTGLNLYTWLHASVVVMLLLVAPALTADTISRERRERSLWSRCA